MKNLSNTKSKIYFIVGALILILIGTMLAVMLGTHAQANTDTYADHVPGEVIVCVETDPYFGELDNSTAALDQINNQMNSFLANYDSESILCFTGHDAVYNAVSNDASMITVHDVSDSYTKPAQTRYVKIKFDEGQKSMSQMIKELESLSIVKYAEPNYISELSDATPNFTDEQYAYDNEEAQGTTHNKAGMNVAGWNNSSTPNIASDKQTVVAVIDSGVDYNHEDIKTAQQVYGDLNTITGMGGKYGYNAGAVSGEVDTDPMDSGVIEHGHGTHVAGIIAAQWNNIGVSGGAFDCSVLPVRASNATTGKFYSDAIMRAYGYVIKAKQNRIDVKAANNSWGGATSDLFVYDMVTKAGENGIITVFATGNDTKNIDIQPYTTSCLQNNPYSITVNSSNELGYASAFSNYGKNTTDVFAPGQNIYSTVPSWQGTSNQNLMESDIRHMQSGEYEILDDFETDSAQWKFSYYRDKELQHPITDAAPSEGYGPTGQPGNALKTNTEETVRSYVCVTGNYADISDKARLALLFKSKATCQNADMLQCSIVDMNNTEAGYIAVTNMSSVSCGQAYYPLSVPTSKITNYNGKFKIAIDLIYFDNKCNEYKSDFYIDKISKTDKVLPYKYMSGTSMASPACCGMVAVLAANNPTEPIEKIVARIKAGTSHKDQLNDLCYTGGIVNLDRASSANEDNLDPVVLDAKLTEYTDTTSTIKLSGYFLGNANSAVTINDIPASNVIAGTDGTRQTLTCTFASKITGSISVKVDKSGNSLTKIFDIGNSGNTLERINMPDKSTFKEYYESITNNLAYASDNYLVSNSFEINGDDCKSYIYNINNKQWTCFNYPEQIKNAFVQKGETTSLIGYLCADNDTLVYAGITTSPSYKCVGFAYYDINTGSISIDTLDSSDIPAFGFIDSNTMYVGCQSMTDGKTYMYSFDLNTKEFKKISDAVVWGTAPTVHKLENNKFLLIDIGAACPLPSLAKNDMYILSIDDQQNGPSATITKIEDQDAYPTSVTQTQNKMTGHATVNGMLMMTGPSITDETSKEVVADTFVRNLQTKEEVAIPGLLNTQRVFQSYSANTNDYVYTYFIDSNGPAIAKRYVGNPVPPTPDPEHYDPTSSAATGDVYGKLVHDIANFLWNL